MTRIADWIRRAVAPRPFAAALLLGAAVAAALVARSWLDAHQARVHLQATLEAQQQVIAAAEKREQQRAQDLRDALAQIAALKVGVTTPQQVVRELPRYLSLPQPIQITLPGAPQASPPAANSGSGAAGLGASGGAPAHDAQQGSGASEKSAAPAVAQMPVEDLKPLFDFVQDCRACNVQLAAAQADRSDDQVKLAALTKERDAAVRAAKGGGFWLRLRRGAKWFLIGGAVGAAAVAAASR